MITKYKAWGWLSLFLLILAIVYLFMFAITDDWSESLIITVFGFPVHLIFIVFGSGCIIKGFFQISERPILKAAIAGKPPEDGHRVAIFGTVEPISEPTRSPFGQKACIGYKYFIMHRQSDFGPESSTGEDNFPIIAAGWALAPAKIISNNDVIRLGGFPVIEDFLEEEKEYSDRSRKKICKNGIIKMGSPLFGKEFPDEEYDDKSRQHLEATISSIDFEMAGYQKWFVRNINDVTPDSILFGESLYHRIEDNNKGFRKDIKFYKKLESDYIDRRPDKTEETLIPIGAEVCVFGTYVADQKAIVPGRWRSMRLISGDRSKVLESMRMNYWAWFFLGLILISIEVGGILYLTS